MSGPGSSSVPPPGGQQPGSSGGYQPHYYQTPTVGGASTSSPYGGSTAYGSPYGAAGGYPASGFQQQQHMGYMQQPPQQQYYYPPPQHQQQQPLMMASIPPTPVAAAAAASSPDLDFYKGFYDGVSRAQGSYFGTVMSWVGPLAVNMALFVGPIWWMRRRYMQQAAAATATGGAKAAKGGMSSLMEMMNPLKPKNYRVEVKGTSFNDVIGIPEAKEELKQYVDFLADPSKFTRLGARLPKGCLLTGQPGTGKTLLARAVAGEAKTAFFACSGADFIEVFGGSGPKRVRELFAEAKESTPCVVFIDEIDAIGSRGSGRGMGGGGGGGSSEENRTINQLLAELDGLTSSSAIVVIAATNYPDNVDKALLRDGRFDRKVNIPMPDLSARTDLFEFYLNRIVTGDAACKPKPMLLKLSGASTTTSSTSTDGSKPAEATTSTSTTEATEIPIVPVVVEGVSNRSMAKELADRTPGTSPAQINAIVNEAALAAAVAEETRVTISYLHNAIDDVLVGKKHRQRMSDASLRRTAYHECGHAIMAWTNPLQKDVLKISVIPRGRAGGYTQQVHDEALDPKTDVFLFSQLCVLLGGRVAERIVMGDISTGAVDDLQRATKIAMDKLLSYGMGNEIGQLAFRGPGDKSNGRAWFAYSENLHARVEKEARALVEKAYDHTVATLEQHRPKLVELAEELLRKKELMREDVVRVMGERPIAAAVVDASKKAATTAAAATTVKA